MLVTLPEETPVNELVDTAYHLEDRVGVSLGPVVVNGLYPEIAGLDADPAAAAEAAGTSLRDGEADGARGRGATSGAHRDGAAARAGRPAGRRSSRCRSCTCRTCSTPTSDRPSSRCSPPRCSTASARCRRTGS